MTQQTVTTLQTARDRKFASWFDGRFWRVVTELSGERMIGGVRIVYDRGHFDIDKPGVFQTPLGHKGRSGFVLKETDNAGADLPGVRPVCFGRATLEHAVEQFGSVSGLPAAA